MWRLGWAHPLCPRGAWVLPQCCTHPYTYLTLGLPAWRLGTPTTHTWRLGTPRPNYLWASHSAEPKIALGHWLCRAQNRFGLLQKCTLSVWAPASLLGTSLHTHCPWAACLGPGHTPAHTWCLGCAGHVHARAPLGHTWRLGHAAESKGNGPGITTQVQWVVRKDLILNIIICFRNIIIFIIINIINKIINKFQIKYYY